jgi:hypothetical protein
MKADDFYTLVAEMRTAQRDYFRTRSTEALSRSKELERKVDNAIKGFVTGQTSLFE